MHSYNVYSPRTNNLITYDLVAIKPQIFCDELIAVLNRNESFELGGEKLSQSELTLKGILLKLIHQRSKEIKTVPPNYEEREVLGEKLLLNLRDEIDDKLFWFGGLHRLINDAVIHNYYLKFIPNDGTKVVDNTIPGKFRIN